MRRKCIAEPEIILGPEVGSLLLLGLTIGVVLSPSFIPDFVQEHMKTMQNDQRTGLFLAEESGTSEHFAAELSVIFAGDDKYNYLKGTVRKGNRRRKLKHGYIRADNIKEIEKLLYGFVSDSDEVGNRNFCNGQLHLDDFLLNDVPFGDATSRNCSADQIIERLTININKNRRMTKYRENVVRKWSIEEIWMKNKVSFGSIRRILADGKLSRKKLSFEKMLKREIRSKTNRISSKVLQVFYMNKRWKSSQMSY